MCPTAKRPHQALAQYLLAIIGKFFFLNGNLITTRRNHLLPSLNQKSFFFHPRRRMVKSRNGDEISPGRKKMVEQNRLLGSGSNGRGFVYLALLTFFLTQ
jgi:hypothetical protein